MTWDGILKSLIDDAATLLVALLGFGSVLFTQWKADKRQAELAAVARASQRAGDLLDKQRAAGAELIAATRSLAIHSRSVLKEQNAAAHLTSAERSGVDRAYALVAMLCEPPARAAAGELVDGMYQWITTFSDDDWEALDRLEEHFIAAVNGESVSATTP